MGKFVITEEEKKHIMGLYEQSMGGMVGPQTFAMASKEGAEFILNMNIDDLINITSAVLEGIPGVGTVASFGIDVAHSISYFARIYMSKTEEEKIKNFLSGILTVGTSVIPAAGNIINITSRGLITEISRLTPFTIAKMLGLTSATINLSKWKYCLVALLYRLFRQECIDFLSNIYTLIKKFENINLGETFKKTLNYILKSLQEMIDIAKKSKPNFLEIDNFENKSYRPEIKLPPTYGPTFKDFGKS